MHLYSKSQLGLHSSEVLTRAGGSTSKVAYPHGWQVSGCFWQDISVLPHENYFIGLLKCLHNMEAGFLQKKQSNKQQRSFSVIHDLTSETTYYHFSNFLSVTWSTLFNMGGIYSRPWILGGEDYWAPSWRLAIKYKYCSVCIRNENKRPRWPKITDNPRHNAFTIELVAPGPFVSRDYSPSVRNSHFNLHKPDKIYKATIIGCTG